MIPNESAFALMLRVSFVTTNDGRVVLSSVNLSSLPFSRFQVGKPRKKCVDLSIWFTRCLSTGFLFAQTERGTLQP